MTTPEYHDPKGLMKDAFVIEGITIGECRSIFLDWALGLPTNLDTAAQAQMIIAAFSGTADTAHPMLVTLREATLAAPQARRRGGRQKRLVDRTD